MFTVIGVIAVVYLGFAATLYFAQRAFMYAPDTRRLAPGDAGAAGMTEVFDEADPAFLIGWFKAPAPGAVTVLYFHGNAGAVADRAYKARAFIDQGWGVMLVEYRGYGGNAGSPTERGLYEDAGRALNWMTERGVAAGDILLYGESLGTGVATEIALRLAKKGTPARGLVLEAPFTSMGRAAEVHYPIIPARYMVKDKYDSLSKIAGVDTPLLILHGSGDRVVPLSQGQRLFDGASEPKDGVWLDGVSHSNVFESGGFQAVVERKETLFRKR